MVEEVEIQESNQIDENIEKVSTSDADSTQVVQHDTAKSIEIDGESAKEKEITAADGNENQGIPETDATTVSIFEEKLEKDGKGMHALEPSANDLLDQKAFLEFEDKATSGTKEDSSADHANEYVDGEVKNTEGPTEGPTEKPTEGPTEKPTEEYMSIEAAVEESSIEAQSNPKDKENEDLEADDVKIKMKGGIAATGAVAALKMKIKEENIAKKDAHPEAMGGIKVVATAVALKRKVKTSEDAKTDENNDNNDEVVKPMVLGGVTAAATAAAAFKKKAQNSEIIEIEDNDEDDNEAVSPMTFDNVTGTEDPTYDIHDKNINNMDSTASPTEVESFGEFSDSESIFLSEKQFLQCILLAEMASKSGESIFRSRDKIHNLNDVNIPAQTRKQTFPDQEVKRNEAADNLKNSMKSAVNTLTTEKNQLQQSVGRWFKDAFRNDGSNRGSFRNVVQRVQASSQG